jgi:hypothetical protein
MTSESRDPIMHPELNDLAAVLEEEIAVGEELSHNLAAQRQALICWDMDTLIAKTEARGPWLRSLGELEVRRHNLLAQGSAPNESVTLRRLIAAYPDDLQARHRLQTLRARARETFVRLQADERNVNGLMENLLSHLNEALRPLARPAVSLYGDTGAAAVQRPSSALIRNKA